MTALSGLVALGGFVALLGAGCGLEPVPPVMEFTVSPDTQFAFEDEGLEPADAAVAAGQVEGALQLLFGSPARPGYLVLEAWEADERDPNFGQDELDDAAWEAVARDNEVRFARQLEAVRKGDHVQVPRPWGAVATWARWKWAFSPLIEARVDPSNLHPSSPVPGDSDEPSFTWADEAERFWQRQYPALVESAALYQRHCVHCHGVTGAGDGPSGVTLEPAPRDFRRGVFKWSAVEAGHRPRRADLLRVLERGVEGTAMPSFARLTRAEREGLVDWVRLLAVRGETELLVTALAAQRGSVTPELATQAYGRTWSRWDEAADRLAEVPAMRDPDAFTPEDVARGAALFAGDTAKCTTCHGAAGHGDGDAIWELDEDGARTRRLDLWGAPSAPRDLTLGVFHGGDRPADLYRRIRYGIGGTIMPAADPGLSEDDVFALVAYVLSLRGPRFAPATGEVPR
ncbi:MAG: cytochrome c [Planctomycetota bacterium]